MAVAAAGAGAGAGAGIPTAVCAAVSKTGLKFCDIGANMTDGMFLGRYHGKSKHEADLDDVLARAKAVGVDRIIITGTNLKEARAAFELAKAHPGLYSTVGVHPTNTKSFGRTPEEAAKVTADLLALAQEGMKAGKVVAIGECGLDWARTRFSPKAVQLAHFERHFELAEATGLPLFLHDRETEGAFFDTMARNKARLPRSGVVHSFTGSREEMEKLLELGLSIGINGCSLKTEVNCAVAAAVPLDRLMLETDAPWCGVRPTHAGHKHVATTWPSKKPERFVRGECVKGRAEPAHIWQVAEVMAAIRNESLEEIAAAAYRNSEAMFFPSEAASE